MNELASEPVNCRRSPHRGQKALFVLYIVLYTFVMKDRASDRASSAAGALYSSLTSLSTAPSFTGFTRHLKSHGSSRHRRGIGGGGGGGGGVSNRIDSTDLKP
jgi:hypothetical protein